MASGNLDEELSEAVRQYPCLYDKAKKGHCDKNLIKNCWREVAEKVGLEDGDTALRLFTNLKKRYNKARMTAECGTGSSRNKAVNKKKKFDELSYLSWLNPFIQLRGTRTNFKAMASSSHHSSEGESSNESEPAVTKPIDDEVDEEQSKKLSSDIDELQNNLNTIKDIGKDDDQLLSPTSIVSESSNKRKYIETPTLNTKKTRKISETTGREKWNQKKESTIDEAQVSFFKTVEKSLNQPNTVSIDDPNDVFGRFIACELKQLSVREQRIAKHEMENILFKIQMQSDSQKQNFQPIPTQYRPYSVPQQFQQLNHQSSYGVPSCQQYTGSLQNSSSHYNVSTSQQNTGLLQPFQSYGASSQQYASSAQTFPSSQQYAGSTQNFPPCTQAYPAQNNPNESEPQRSPYNNINEDINHYSDETEY